MAGGTSLGCFIGWRRCSREVPAVALAAACSALAAAVAAAALAAALAALGTALAAAALVVALAAAALAGRGIIISKQPPQGAASKKAWSPALERSALGICVRARAPLSPLGGLSQAEDGGNKIVTSA